MQRARARELEAWNAPVGVAPDLWVRVPFLMLTAELQSLVLRNLFPEDHHDGTSWVHLARAGRLPTYDEGLWQVAEWFVGTGDAFDELMTANGLSSPELRRGQEIRIPDTLARPVFRARLRSDDGALEYGSDEDGPFAAYRLKPLHLSRCPQCRSAKLPHRICPNCGTYRGRQVIGSNH